MSKFGPENQSYLLICSCDVHLPYFEPQVPFYGKFGPEFDGDCNWTRTQNHLVRKQTLNQMGECSFTN